MVLDIGCGMANGTEMRRTVVRENIIGIDVRRDSEAEVIADITKGLPFDNEKFDIVFASHILEHFGKYEIDGLIDEWLRVLKKGGELWIYVPNLKWCAEAILKGKDILRVAAVDRITVMHQIYGGENYLYDFHKWGFTLETLSQTLLNHGLEIVKSTEWGGEADLEHKPEVCVVGRKV